MKLNIKIRKEDLSFLQRGKNFENTFNGVLIAASKSLGKQIVTEMKNTMVNNDYAANEPEYAAWKAEHGYDTRVLFRTRLLHNSIASETKISLPNSVGGEVGWHPGATYPGYLQQRTWKRAVPKVRKRPPKSSSGKGVYSASPRMSHHDVSKLADIAHSLEGGAGQEFNTKTVAYDVKNGFTKKGTQKYKTKTKEVKEITRMGREGRPFVSDTREKVGDLVFNTYFNATSRALGRVYYMSKYWQGRLRNPDEVPF